MQVREKIFRLNLNSLLAICFIIAYMVPYINYKGGGDDLPFIIFSVWLTTVLLKKNQIDRLLYVLSFRKLELSLLFIFFIVTLFYYFFVTTTNKAFQFTLVPIIYFFLIVIDAY